MLDFEKIDLIETCQKTLKKKFQLTETKNPNPPLES